MEKAPNLINFAESIDLGESKINEQDLKGPISSTLCDL